VNFDIEDGGLVDGEVPDYQAFSAIFTTDVGAARQTWQAWQDCQCPEGLGNTGPSSYGCSAMVVMLRAIL
jgi:hypothetical protein